MDVGNFIVVLIYAIYLIILIFQSDGKSIRLFEATDSDVKDWMKMKEELETPDDTLEESEWRGVVRIYKDYMVIRFLFLAFNLWWGRMIVLDFDTSKKHFIVYAIICSVLIYVKYYLEKGREHRKVVGWVKNQYITTRKARHGYSNVYHVELVYSQGGNHIQGIKTTVHRELYQCFKLNRRCMIILCNDRVIDVREF